MAADSPEVQVRTYAVKPGALAAFCDEWRRMVVPLRERHGFLVLSAWSSLADDRFVWIVAGPPERSFADCEADYYTDPERSGLNPDPARHLDHVETVMVRPVQADAC